MFEERTFCIFESNQIAEGGWDMDLRDLRNCFGQFATGVTVVTWHDDQGNKNGITVNSFTSVSLDPALVLVSIDKNTKAIQALQNRSFVVNILSESQEQHAWQFAGRPQEDFEVEWAKDSAIGPIIKNTVATIQCSPWATYEAGDHLLFVGEVKDYSYKAAKALLFLRGKFSAL